MESIPNITYTLSFDNGPTIEELIDQALSRINDRGHFLSNLRELLEMDDAERFNAFHEMGTLNINFVNVGLFSEPELDLEINRNEPGSSIEVRNYNVLMRILERLKIALEQSDVP